jgi:hypothetical protein
MTVRELYEQSIKPLAPAQRYELATIILGDIPPQSIVDYSEEWSEEDMRDFMQHNWKRIESNSDFEYDG